MLYEYSCGHGSRTHIIVDFIDPNEHCILDRNNSVVHLKSEYVIKKKSVVKLVTAEQRKFYVDRGYNENNMENFRIYLTITEDIPGISSLGELNFLALGNHCGNNYYRSSVGDRLPLINASKKPNMKSKSKQEFHKRLSVEEKELLCSLMTRFIMSS